MLHHGYHNTNTLISHNSANPRWEWIIQNMKVHSSYVECEKPLKNSHCQLSSKKGPGMPLHKVDQLPHWKPPAKQCLGRCLRCVRCRWLLWPTAWGFWQRSKKWLQLGHCGHYFLQLGRNGLRKQTFATLTKPHGMIPIFPIKCVWCPHWRATARKTRSWFPQKHRMGLRYGVYLRTDLFSSKLSTYLRIFCHISSNISSTYSKFYPHVPHVLYYIYLLVCRWIFHTCTGYVPWI